MTKLSKNTESQQSCIATVITRFSGDERLKLQKHFTSLYGTDEISQEKANSFAVGFGKACDMIISALNE